MRMVVVVVLIAEIPTAVDSVVFIAVVITITNHVTLTALVNLTTASN